MFLNSPLSHCCITQSDFLCVYCGRRVEIASDITGQRAAKVSGDICLDVVSSFAHFFLLLYASKLRKLVHNIIITAVLVFPFFASGF